jgi:hypothetical protein
VRVRVHVWDRFETTATPMWSGTHMIRRCDCVCPHRLFFSCVPGRSLSPPLVRLGGLCWHRGAQIHEVTVPLSREFDEVRESFLGIVKFTLARLATTRATSETNPEKIHSVMLLQLKESLKTCVLYRTEDRIVSIGRGGRP